MCYRIVAFLVTSLLCCSAAAQNYFYTRPQQRPPQAITVVKVFIDEYGVPYDAQIIQSSFIRHADEKAFQQAISQRYEPITGPQGERGPGWRIVNFHTPIR